MKLDTTVIESSLYVDNATCVTYKDNVLTVYSTDGITPVATEYHRLGNTWLESSFISGQSATGTSKCYTVEEVLNFNSPYDFIDPIFHTMAIVSAFAIGFAAVVLILKPFLRRV